MKKFIFGFSILLALSYFLIGSVKISAQDTTQTSTPAVKEQSDNTTMGERNALSKALSYLDVMAFSYSGLIKQLEYEGYSYEEAKYGVDNCGANWN